MLNFVMKVLSWVNWDKPRKLITGKSFNLTWHDWIQIAEKLQSGYFIILTYRKSHLSSYAVQVGHFVLTGKFGDYSHALCNIEPDKKGYDLYDFKFIEAVGKGVVRDYWWDTMNVDRVCILKPKYYTQAEFDSCVTEIYDEIGKSYDKNFKYNDPKQRSCVEIARERMIHLPDYFTKMRVFEYMIQNEKNLTPQMFRDCPDFEVVLEIKR